MSLATLFLTLSRKRAYRIRPALLGAVVLLITALFALPARAADTVLTFDDIPAPSPVALTTQYSAKGITFDHGAVETGFPTKTGTNAAIGPHSGELSSGYINGTFSNPHHNSISVWVVAQSLSVGMTVYDPGHNVLADVNIPAGATPGVYYKLQYNTASRNIAAFTVGGEPSGTSVVLDDLRYDDIGNLQGPDFYFSPYYGHIALASGGGAQTVRMRIGRLAGSTGFISGVIANLPIGVNATFSSNPFTGDYVDISLQAVAGAPSTNGKENNAILIGDPTAAAGAYGQRKGYFSVSVASTFDLRIVGVEVTQGVQPYTLQQRDPANPTAPVSYSQPGRAGVPLAEDGKTSVRVFINQATNYSGSFPGYLIHVRGFRVSGDGQRTELTDSPIYPDTISGTPGQGDANVSDKHRQGKEGAIATFTLPWTWSRGKVELDAEIEYTPTFLPVPAFDTNFDDNKYVMTDIVFTQLYSIGIRPVELIVTAPGAPYPMPQPYDVFHQAQKVHPGPYYTLATGTWSRSMDITDIWNQTDKACGFLGLGSCPESPEGRAQSVIARLQDMADDIKNYYYYLDVIGDMIIGIFPSNDAGTNLRAMTVKSCDGPYWGCDGNPVAIVRSQNRPLSSVAHEAGHMLGRNHAGGACGASAEKSPFDPWLPDGQGFLGSVGYDWENQQVFFPPKDGTNPIFDIMSYCGNNSGNDPDKWDSVTGYNLEFTQLIVPKQQSNPGGIPLQTGGPLLIVRAMTGEDGFATFTKVALGHPANPILSDPDSPYHLVAKNAAGATITEVPMLREEMEAVDNQFMLSAYLNPSGIQSLEILKSGTLIARQIKSANAPQVQNLVIQPDVIRAGVRLTHAQWQATDTDGDKLMTKVDYSTDNGQNWKPIFFGPNSNRVDLKSALFTKSAAGLVRVRVNDGFNETTTVSGAFSAAGSPPTALIYNPKPDETIQTGKNVQLLGYAFDDDNQAVPDAGMKWYEDTTLLGTGQGITIHDLKPGSHTFRLEATSATGNVGSQKVTVNILK